MSNSGKSAARLRRREIPELPQSASLHNVPAWLLSVLLHVAILVIISLVWVAQPRGTGGAPDRPVGIAVVYETSGGEAYFLDAAGVAKQGSSESTAPSDLESQLPASIVGGAQAQIDSLLAGLLPTVDPSGGAASQAAGGLGLGDGGASVGGDRTVPKLKTTVFGIEGEGTRFLYVFDRSESMLGYGGAPLRRAKSELLQSIESLGEVHQFQIVFYNDAPLPFGGMSQGGPRLFKGDPQSKQAAARFVRDITAAGGTRHVDALRMALAMGPDVVFFLTDADSSPAGRDIEDLHARAARGGTTIHTIQFGSGPGRSGSWIQRLAEGTAGKYRYVDVASLENQ